MGLFSSSEMNSLLSSSGEKTEYQAREDGLLRAAPKRMYYYAHSMYCKAIVVNMGYTDFRYEKKYQTSGGEWTDDIVLPPKMALVPVEWPECDYLSLWKMVSVREIIQMEGLHFVAMCNIEAAKKITNNQYQHQVVPLKLFHFWLNNQNHWKENIVLPKEYDPPGLSRSSDYRFNWGLKTNDIGNGQVEFECDSFLFASGTILIPDLWHVRSTRKRFMAIGCDFYVLEGDPDRTNNCYNPVYYSNRTIDWECAPGVGVPVETLLTIQWD